MLEYTRIGNYQIETALPHTGAARAFRARSTGGETVVVKLYPSFLQVNRAQVQRTSEVLALFGSPVFVPIYDIGVWQGQFYMVSPWMPGGSLEDVLRQEGRLPLGQATQYLYRLAFGLSGLHSLGYLHRNIKPTNVLFNQEGEACLADISLAPSVLVSAQDSLSLELEDPRYASPEQVRGRHNLNVRSDVYALGTLYYAMLTGAPPVGSLRGLQAILSAARQSGVPVSERKPQIPKTAADLLDRMLAHDPVLRLPSIDAVVMRTESILPSERVTAIRTRSESTAIPYEQLSALRPRQAEETRRSRRKQGLHPLVVGMLILVALVAGALAALWQADIPLTALLGGEMPSPVAVAQANPTITQTSTVVPSPSVTPSPVWTATSSAAIPVANATPTAEPTVQFTPTPTSVVLGGADKIAFLAQNDIWIANVDGSDLQRLTVDEKPKADLTWSSDGKDIYFTQNGAGYLVNITTGKTRNGVAPKSTSRCTLRIGRMTRYSLDGRMAATVVQVSGHGRKEDVVQIYTFDEDCQPDMIDAFPGDRFTMRGYSGSGDLGVIEEYAWDGRDTFILHGNVLHNGGDMVTYNLQTHKAEVINPLEGHCCYRDIHFSPDGEYVAFVFQDVRYTNPAEVYYVPLAMLGSGARFQPLPFPSYFFAGNGVDVSLAVRPYVPPVQPTPTPSTGSAQAKAVEIGGADKLALVVDKDIWVVNLNGQGAERLTSDHIDKAYLAWSPDGQYVLYEQASCLKAVSLADHSILNLGCYLSYGISSDGRHALLSASVLFPDGLHRPLTSIVPFNLHILDTLPDYVNLALIGACEIDLLGDRYVWSPDGQQVAALAETSAAGRKEQAVLVYELRACGQPPRLLDTFPANRFEVRGYSDLSTMPKLYDFAWNGDNLFAINGAVHDGFGDFVLYDMSTGRASTLDPLQKGCCYREMRWGQDASYVLFGTEDPVEGIKLYYVPFSALDEGKPLAPIPLPAGFFHQADTRKRLYPALRPAQRPEPLPFGQAPEVTASETVLTSSGSSIQVGSSSQRIVHSLAFSPDSNLLAVGFDRGLALYDMSAHRTTALGTKAEYYDRPVTGVDFSHDGTWLASTSVDGVTRIWRVRTGAPFQKVVLEGYSSLDVAYDPSQDLVATASSDFSIHVNQRNNAGTRYVLRGHEGQVTSVDYAADGSLLASGSVDRTVRVWSMQTGDLRQTLVGHLDAVADVDFSPDGQMVASASWDGTVRVWDWESGTARFVLYGHQSPVIGVRFSPDGRWLVSRDTEGGLYVWRVEDGALVQTLETNASPNAALAFSPDGKWLAVGLLTGNVQIYAVAAP